MGTKYGESNYNTSTYNGAVAGVSTGTSTAASGGAQQGGTQGVLTNTGVQIAIIVTAAAVIALTAMVVRIWKRPTLRQSR